MTRIATVDMPAAAAEVRRLATLWSEQHLLDPAAAVVTGRALAAEAQRAEALLADMRRGRTRWQPSSSAVGRCGG